MQQDQHKERPKEADGSRFGDFEMDTIIGKGKGKDAKELAKTVVRLLMPYRVFLKSITTDNGPMIACHEYITKKLGVTVYFTDP